MPELPEVETLRRGLEREVIGRRITGTVVANAKVLKEQTEAAFRARVVGRQIQSIDRRGKYLLLALGDAFAQNSNAEEDSFRPEDQQNTTPSVSPLFLCIHLKMRGQLMLQAAEGQPGLYHCVSLILDNGIALRFHDMWTWGEIRAMLPEELHQESGLRLMGPEALSDEWTSATLLKKLSGRGTAIKAALLDQKVVAGVGNIYADESLFRAGIHPERKAGSLTESEAERLVQSVKTVLQEAVEGGGTTSDDYFDLAGDPGRYTPLVYDRGGQECVHCATVLTRIRLGGRGTVYCSRCQPIFAADRE